MKNYYIEDFTLENKIGQGADGIVYSLEGDKAVKFFRQSRKLRKEIRINQHLAENQIHVPDIYDSIELSFPKDHILHNHGRRQFGLVMEKLDGQNPTYLPSELKLKAKEKFTEYLDQIMTLGYLPVDTGMCNNTFYVPKTEDLAFFDFARWLEFFPDEGLKKRVINHPTDPVKGKVFYSCY
jgi:hypothetical protein